MFATQAHFGNGAGPAFPATKSGSNLDWLALLQALLDQRPFPALILDAALRVQLVNSASRSEGVDFASRIAEQRGLVLRCPEADEWLHKAIRRVVEEAHSAAIPQVARFNFASGPLALALSPLNCAIRDQHNSASIPLFVLTVRASLTAVEIAPGKIAATFGLTPAEAKLASALAGGLSLSDYATREKLQLSTVRWHLRNIFERSETSSQAELIGLIMAVFG